MKSNPIQESMKTECKILQEWIVKVFSVKIVLSTCYKLLKDITKTKHFTSILFLNIISSMKDLEKLMENILQILGEKYEQTHITKGI